MLLVFDGVGEQNYTIIQFYRFLFFMNALLKKYIFEKYATDKYETLLCGNTSFPV